MVNIKLRLTSFFTGFAVAGALAMWQIRQDVLRSSEFLAAQAQQVQSSLDQRITALETLVAKELPVVAAAAVVATEQQQAE